MALTIDRPPAGVPIWANPHIWLSNLPATPLNVDISHQVVNPVANFTPGYLMTADMHDTGAAGTSDSGAAWYYWADPSTAITLATAHQVGVDPNPAASHNGKSFTIGGATHLNEYSNPSWPFATPPLTVNGGHICMIVALTDSPTSVPASLNPNLPNVAQRNLNLVAMGMGVKMFHMAFEMGAPDGEDGPGTYRLEMKQAPTEELKRLLEAFRLDLPLQGVEGKVGNFGVMDFTPCVDEQALKHARPALERVEMRPYQRRGLTLAGTLDGDAALVHVIQYREKGDIVGGISMLVYHTRDEKK